MVTRYGMSENLGPIALGGRGGRALFGAGVHGDEYSEEVSAKIDAEVTKIMGEAKKRAETIVKKHKKLLEIIAEALIEKETLEQDEFEKILLANGVVLKKKD
jgi:cell division protease FtsH